MEASHSILQNKLNPKNQEIKQIIQDVIRQIEKDVAHLGKPNSEIKIAVAMSGGVDSSVCPIFFKEAGFDVKGITLKLYENKHEKQGACCSFRDIFDAKRVCQQLGIEHYVVNYEKEFKKEVIDKFISDYVSGKTPIPCVQCNQVIKFNYMFELIKDLEFDFLVTGHYVLRKTNNESGKPSLFMPDDRAKDQTYFLYNITGERLKQILFPLGRLSKSQIRAIADFYSIQTSKKPESQDICFVEGDSYRDFLKEAEENGELANDVKLNELAGNLILNSTGQILGKHEGIQNFTIGQRRGLGVSHSTPLYVVKIDEKTKEVFLGEKHELLAEVVNFGETSWVDEQEILEKIMSKKDGLKIDVRLRSMHRNIPALLSFEPGSKIFSAKLLEPQYLVCPGQACVVYEGERLLGGGTIL